MDDKAKARQDSYLKRRARAGLVRVSVVVPENRAEEIKAIAVEMRGKG